MKNKTEQIRHKEQILHSVKTEQKRYKGQFDIAAWLTIKPKLSCPIV